MIEYVESAADVAYWNIVDSARAFLRQEREDKVRRSNLNFVKRSVENFRMCKLAEEKFSRIFTGIVYNILVFEQRYRPTGSIDDCLYALRVGKLGFYVALLNEFAAEHAMNVQVNDPTEIAKNTVIGAAEGAVVSTVIVAGIPVLLGVLGFSTTGVVGFSIASRIQSVFYRGFTRGIFSVCQRIGVKGLSTATYNMAAGAGGCFGSWWGFTNSHANSEAPFSASEEIHAQVAKFTWEMNKDERDSVFPPPAAVPTKDDAGIIV